MTLADQSMQAKMQLCTELSPRVSELKKELGASNMAATVSAFIKVCFLSIFETRQGYGYVINDLIAQAFVIALNQPCDCLHQPQQ